LIATDDPRVSVVAAISPSSVVWANIGPGIDGVAWTQRSSWARGGVPLPFIKYDETWLPETRDGLITYRSLYERSLKIADNVSAATIPVEKALAKIILVAGGDDALWPSEMFAKSIEGRLASATGLRERCDDVEDDRSERDNGNRSEIPHHPPHLCAVSARKRPQ
jgi:uncharacterized protein